MKLKDLKKALTLFPTQMDETEVFVMVGYDELRNYIIVPLCEVAATVGGTIEDAQGKSAHGNLFFLLPDMNAPITLKMSQAPLSQQ